MRSTLIVILATVGGIVLAWLLFAPAPTAMAPAPKPTAAVSAPAAPPEKPAPGSSPDRVTPEQHAEINATFQARINQPDAALSGQQASNWTVIRRELASNPDPGAQALMGEVSDLVRDLREARLRPDSADTKSLATRQADIRKRIEGSSYKTPLMNEQIKRLDDMQASFDQTAGQPPQPPGPGALELANRPGGVNGPPPASTGAEPTSVPPFAPNVAPPPGTVSSDEQ